MLVKITELTKKRGEKNSPDNISLTVEGKGVHGILGPEGSGKTSLLNIICGVERFDAGSVRVGQYDMSSEARAAKEKIGYVPEKVSFYGDDTVLETLDFIGSAKKVSPDKRYRQIKEALELTRMEGTEKKLVSALSLGERKKLALAAALLGNPELIVLDEPMKDLGDVTKGELSEIIAMLGNIKSVIVSSATPSDIEALCGDFVMLSEGRCLLHSTAEEIKAKLNRVRSVSLKLKGDVAAVSDILDGAEGVTKFNFTVNSEKIIEVTVEYSSDHDKKEELSAIFEEKGFEVISAEAFSLSVSDAYYVLTKTKPEPKKAKKTEETEKEEKTEKEEEEK